MNYLKLFTLLVFCFFLNSFSSYAQGLSSKADSYKLVLGKTKNNKSYYHSALSSANLENFRLQNKETTLSFKDGTKCILLPASKLIASGESINISDYKESFPDKYSLPIFSIHSSGHLIANYTKKLK